MDWATFNLDHIHKSTRMFGVGWVVAASLKPLRKSYAEHFEIKERA